MRITRSSGTALAGITLAAVLAAGCGAAASPGGAAPASAPAHPAASLPPDCAKFLAILPKAPPGTPKEATDDFSVLSAGVATTQAAKLANDVGADSMKLQLDLSSLLPAAADIARWQADAKALRAYCGR